MAGQERDALPGRRTGPGETAPVGVAVFDPTGPCLYADRRAFELLGATQGQGPELDFLKDAEWRRTGLQDAAQTALATGEPVERRMDPAAGSGSRARLRVQFQRLDIPDKPLLLATVYETPPAPTGLAPRGAPSVVPEQAVAGRLAAEVAHELNNQLLVLHGHIELLHTAFDGSPDQVRRFDAIYASLRRLDVLGRGVMAFGQRQPRGARSTVSDAPRGVRRGETILLAEDEEHVRDMVSEALRAQGYRVIEASDGERALAAALGHEGTIHLLLTDVVMPGMDGGQLYDALLERHAGLPVIFMSGYSESDSHRLHELAGKGRYLQKPFSLHFLAHRIREALDG